MGDSRGKHGILRRLSFRRRRTGSPPAAEESSATHRHTPPPTPASSVSSTATRTTSSSTSTSTLDIHAATAGEGGTSEISRRDGGGRNPAGSDPRCPARNSHEQPLQSASPAPSLVSACSGCEKRSSISGPPGPPGPSGSELSEQCQEETDSPASSALLASCATSDKSSDAADVGNLQQFSPADLDLNRVLLHRLECPVCYQPMAPPIRQCLYGHSVCSRCEARLARCPTCRGSFLPSTATNATLNAIAVAVRLPCRHQPCRVLLHLADKVRHEDHCIHREYGCLHSLPHCTWRGTLVNLMEHTLTEHATHSALLFLNQYKDINYTYSRTRPFEVTSYDKGVNRVSKTLLLVEAVLDDEVAITKNNKNATKSESKHTAKGKHNSHVSSGEVVGLDTIGKIQPRALFRFHLRFDATRVLLQAVLQYVGPPTNSRMFRYKVSVGSRDGTFKLSAWSEATAEDVDEVVADGKVLRVDGVAFRHVIDTEGRFLVRVKVVVGRLPPLFGRLLGEELAGHY